MNQIIDNLLNEKISRVDVFISIFILHYTLSKICPYIKRIYRYSYMKIIKFKNTENNISVTKKTKKSLVPEGLMSSMIHKHEEDDFYILNG